LEKKMANPYSAPSAVLSEPLTESGTYEPRLLALSGRLGRVRYFVYGMVFNLIAVVLLFTVIGTAMASIFAGALSGSGVGAGMGMGLGIMQILLAALLYLAILVSSFVYARRRLNDLNKTGWISLVFFLPPVSIILALWLLFAPGTAGTNSYGPAPSPNSRTVVVAAWLLPLLSIGSMLLLGAMSAMRSGGLQ
jgi:uncharacterized membrane protein YhaH (DUF805 family)